MASRVTVTHKTPAQLATGGVNLSATAFGKSWQVTKSDVGSAQVQLANTDANLAAVTFGDFVRFDLDGTPRFLMLVEAIDTVSIAPNEEVDEVTTISGRGSLAQWEQAIVLPPNGVIGQPYTETRVFDWGAAELDITLSTATAPTAWNAAVELFQVGRGSEGTPPADFPYAWLGKPLGWSDPTGYWVWSQALDATPAVPAGTSYFARDVNITADGYHAVYMAADDFHRLKIDGVTISEYTDGGEGFTHTLRADLYLTAGTHRVAVEATNQAYGLGGFVFALWSQDVNRDDDTLVLRADTTWAANGYPATPPGFTAGKVIRVLLEEAQANGALTGWTLDFTDTVDSDGAAWPTDQQWSFRVGMDLLSVLRQLGSSDIDFIADPSSLTLHAYVIDTMGVAAASATATLSDLSYLEFQGRA